MIQEEKAKELIEKFSPLVTTWDCYNDSPVLPEEIIKDAAKCALICVEEILNLSQMDQGRYIGDEHYWQQVKQFLKS